MKRVSETEVILLIEKYFNAETSLSEEEQIRDYYRRTPDVVMSNELKAYRDMFALFDEERESLNNDSIVIDKKSNPLIRPYLMRWISVAAAAVVLIALFLSGPGQSDSLKFYIDGERIKDKELALNMAETNLEKVNHMMKGLERGERRLNALVKADQSISALERLNSKLSQN
ncbi:MAG: hypothetical protein BGO30_00170 [Bacteroidetes bacterium 41-46]|jgi:hypothetical protein|nr:MAG: hypothetical protein BGO30_00170 [Bacteroidetes bacterium 41-46]